jgi:CheY-like chemotaxis protein
MPLDCPMAHSNSPQSDQKTILVVTNDPIALRFISGFLVKCSYNVLIAGSGEDAIRQMKAYRHEIHLLLSAFEMPGINGLGLAAQVSLEWPNLKVLLTADFSGGVLILNEGWHFLPKPFFQSQLIALIWTLISPADAIPRYKHSDLQASARAS